MADSISVDELFELVSYDFASGEFTWKKRSLHWFTSERIYRSWNSRWAGEPAMTVKDGNGYLISHVRKHRIPAHRAVWAFHNGEWPAGEIDHINGIRDDNGIENLRVATRNQNNRNRGAGKNNTSGYKGVSFHRQTGKWRSAIWVNSKRKSLGLFHDAHDAYKAYCAAAIEYHKEFSNVG